MFTLNLIKKVNLASLLFTSYLKNKLFAENFNYKFKVLLSILCMEFIRVKKIHYEETFFVHV